MTSTVHIAKNVYGGDGLGRLGDGRVVFVPGAFKGEQVKAEIDEEKKTFVKARLVDVVESSPGRLGIAPAPAPGMVYANLENRFEMETKGEQLADFFERARLKCPPIPPAEPPPDFLHYRNKVVYHFDRQGSRWLVGYREEPGHRILDMLDDPLARPEINASLPGIRQKVMMLLTQGASAVRQAVERKGNLTIRWSRSSGVKWWIGEAPDATVMKETSCGRTFEVPADGFWQVNPDVGEPLVREVVAEYARGAEAAPDVLDLYCGVGVFGLCCRPRLLTGVESGRQAVDFARKNAESQGVAARFFAQEVGRNLRKLRIGETTTVILDPPRGGLERGVAAFLAKSRAPRIFYISCDPATLVRDLRTLTQAYDISSVKWFNMFPRTARFETFVVLTRRSGR